MELSNVLNSNDNFKLDVLINFVLIKKKEPASAEAANFTQLCLFN